MPTIDFPIDVIIKVGSVAVGKQIDLLVGYSEETPSSWIIEEATFAGINADELGLMDLVEHVASGEYGDRITSACIEAECDRRDFTHEQYLDARSRAYAMREEL